ncbi:MAG: N-acetylmuramoyl-L-alanine amidase, partial [candidate division WOR-3 bacterium]
FLEVNGLIPAKKKRTWPGIKLVKEYEVEPFLNYTRFTFKLTDKHIETILRENELLFLIRERPVFDLIVLDPGHGGIDPGAIGKRGLYEKDCNLAISLRLKKLIEDSLNMKVIMTRDEDVYLSLVQRTRIANRNRADLFLSIHCNASRKKKQPCGIETYFLSEAKTDDARSTAALENASIKFDQPEEFDSDLKKILSDIAQTEFLQESSDLAESIQDEAGRLLPIPNRGINQANFYVLNGAYMPAVLVECAFISNPEEEKLLRETKFRNQLAYTIFCGIRKFIKDYNRRLN